MSELSRAWEWREKRGILKELEAVRVFHGPGEGEGEMSRIAIDRFGTHYWITQWTEQKAAPVSRATLERVVKFLDSKGAQSVVTLARPEQGLPEEPMALFGTPPAERFDVREGEGRFWIRMTGARHPGLFLDHFPLRQWLRARAEGWRVLNTFSYTGSLSIAAAQGNASQVTTLDLSNATIQWASENWKLNELDPGKGRFIAGDVFEWLPRLKREGKVFDCVILDPPSFSRGKKGNFSTARDLGKLHSLALDLLSPEGVLVTSINSANIPWEKFEAELFAVGRERKVGFQILRKFDLPETFPTRLGAGDQRYLKGWILRPVGQ